MSTILVVDDEEPVREVLATLFDEAGYHVVLAAHGGEALANIAQALPDLVISDVMMPVLDGAALCRRLKGDGATRQIPIILMSAAGRPYARGAGADAIIAKPFDIAALEVLVRRLLDGRAPR